MISLAILVLTVARIVVMQLRSMASALGRTALRVCTDAGAGSGPAPAADVLQLLVACGCDVDVTDNAGNTRLRRLVLVQSHSFRALEALVTAEPGSDFSAATGSRTAGPI